MRPGKRPGTHLARVAWLALACLLPACSLLTNPDVQTGVGGRCQSNSDCHAGLCVEGLCTLRCTVDPDCPSPALCVKKDGICQLPLSVRALYVGVATTGEGWTLTHDEGLRKAENDLGYLNLATYENVIADDDISKRVDTEVTEWRKRAPGGVPGLVVVGTSNSQVQALSKKAVQYPDVKYLVCSGVAQGKNVGSYFGHMEQAWYIAGRVAASKAKSRVGIIGSFVNPEVVRHINAFTRGAQSVNPAILVEVRWLGFWYDYRDGRTYTYKGEKLYREEFLAAQMIDSGCDVIAHLGDNQRAVRFIEDRFGKPKNVYSIANDNQFAYLDSRKAGSPPTKSCLGAAYWNWGPLYSRLLSEVQKGVFRAVDVLDPLTASADSVVGFSLNPMVGVDESETRLFVNTVARNGHEKIFEGPYATTGQRSAGAVAQGQRLSSEEWRTMCWFVAGLVEKTVPDDPQSADRPAQVPDVATPPLAELLGPPGAPPNVGIFCSKNR